MKKSTREKREGGRDIDTDIRDGSIGHKTVLGLLSDFEEELAPYAIHHEPLVEENERLLAGGRASIDSDADVGSVSPYSDEDLPVVNANVCTNLALSWASRMAKPRQRVRAWPADPSFSDEAAAELANAYMDYQYQVQDIDAMVTDLCMSAFAGGCAAIKVCWDPDRGAKLEEPVIDEYDMEVLDEDGNVKMEDLGHMGDIYWKRLTIFDYWIDPVEDPAEARWVVFKQVVSKDEARVIVENAGVKEDEIDPESLGGSESKNVLGVKREGVEVYEMWVRPEEGVTKGFYATVIDNHVIDMRDYPYDHGQLPISVFHVRRVRDFPYGRSPMFDIADLQHQYNGYLTSAARIQKLMGDNVRLFCHTSVEKELKDDHQIIGIESPQQLEVTQWLTGPFEVIQHFLDYAEAVRKQIYEVAGLNEVLTGAENAKASQSGKAIAYMQELDSQKLILAARNLDNCLVRAWRQTLRLAQQYVEKDRIIAIAGEGSEVRAKRFVGASIEGIDVRLEPISGVEMTAAGTASKAQEAAAEGMMDPARAAEIMETGLGVSHGEALDAQVVKQQIEAIMQGQMVQPEQGVDTNVAVTEIGLAMEQAQSQGMMQQAMMLNQLLLGYRMQGSQSQQPQQGQQVQGAPMPGQPPAFGPGGQ